MEIRASVTGNRGGFEWDREVRRARVGTNFSFNVLVSHLLAGSEVQRSYRSSVIFDVLSSIFGHKVAEDGTRWTNIQPINRKEERDVG